MCVLFGQGHYQCHHRDDNAQYARSELPLWRYRETAALLRCIGLDIDNIILPQVEVGRNNGVLVVKVHPAHLSAAIGIGMDDHHIVATAGDGEVTALGNCLEHVDATVACFNHSRIVYLSHSVDMKILEADFNIWAFGDILWVNEMGNVVLGGSLRHSAYFDVSQQGKVDIAVVVYQVKIDRVVAVGDVVGPCLLYTSPSPRDS